MVSLAFSLSLSLFSPLTKTDITSAISAMTIARPADFALRTGRLCELVITHRACFFSRRVFSSIDFSPSFPRSVRPRTRPRPPMSLAFPGVATPSRTVASASVFPLEKERGPRRHCAIAQTILWSSAAKEKSAGKRIIRGEVRISWPTAPSRSVH